MGKLLEVPMDMLIAMVSANKITKILFFVPILQLRLMKAMLQRFGFGGLLLSIFALAIVSIIPGVCGIIDAFHAAIWLGLIALIASPPLPAVWALGALDLIMHVNLFARLLG